MKSLEEEAQEYRKNSMNKMFIEERAFIAGANSKWVQAEKIKAQMECLNRVKDLDIQTVYNELKQILKELEDESNN